LSLHLGISMIFLFYVGRIVVLCTNIMQHCTLSLCLIVLRTSLRCLISYKVLLPLLTMIEWYDKNGLLHNDLLLAVIKWKVDGREADGFWEFWSIEWTNDLAARKMQGGGLNGIGIVQNWTLVSIIVW
jgi:hypothetical protein